MAPVAHRAWLPAIFSSLLWFMIASSTRRSPARPPPRLAFGFAQALATTGWPEMGQTAGRAD